MPGIFKVPQWAFSMQRSLVHEGQCPLIELATCHCIEDEVRGPPPDASCGAWIIIRAIYGGVRTSDVAFYNGTRAHGLHWWTLGDVKMCKTPWQS
jgi:hypothetical protein